MLVEIDLADADLDAFDRYEAVVLGAFVEHGGGVLARVRRTDERREWHLLRAPSRSAWAAFLVDPRRVEHDPLRRDANARATQYDVRPVD